MYTHVRAGRLCVHFFLSVVYIGLLWGCQAPAADAPRLLFDATVGSDLRTLADETWEQFLSTFAAHRGCIEDVTLRAERNLSSRALYDPGSATVSVRVPATPAFLRAALVHEWAHHVEFHCASHQQLRSAVLATLQLPPDTPWHAGETWETTASEHYAEAVVEIVLGEHPLPTKIRVQRKTVGVVADWILDDN